MSKKNGFSAKWLESALEKNPQLSADYGNAKKIREEITRENHPDAQLPHPKPERHKKAALGSATQGEEESLPRTTVRFTGFRVRPLDPDNFAGSVKDCLDGLRHASLIDGDEPWKIRLETEQVKVRSFKDEKTVIEIEYPEGLTPNFDNQGA